MKRATSTLCHPNPSLRHKQTALQTETKTKPKIHKRRHLAGAGAATDFSTGDATEPPTSSVSPSPSTSPFTSECSVCFPTRSACSAPSGTPRAMAVMCTPCGKVIVVSYKNGTSNPGSLSGTTATLKRCTTDARVTVVASRAKVPPMHERGPLPKGVYVKSRPAKIRRLMRSICIRSSSSSASGPADSRARRSDCTRMFASVKRSGSKSSGRSHTRGFRPMAQLDSSTRSPAVTTWPVGSTSSFSTRRGNRLMGAYLRSDSFTTR
mmetsp:Transcript_390/g.610  ORF Transcript_390/g.610 Transcript_390/m.610 type:complete len:265 (-) Transcript_390:1301-2095(-)